MTDRNPQESTSKDYFSGLEYLSKPFWIPVRHLQFPWHSVSVSTYWRIRLLGEIALLGTI